MNNYYEELEVSKSASKEVIEKAYRVLAKKYHPDTTNEPNKKTAEEKFKIISEAYEVLSNDEKRKKYDLELEQSNPTISYEDYMDVVNQRDTINNAFNEFKNSYNQHNNNEPSFSNTQINEDYYTNQYQHNQNINNYKIPNVNSGTGKKYYYNTVTGQPVSAFYYYKYIIKNFFYNLFFYILLILVLFLAFKAIISLDLIKFLL